MARTLVHELKTESNKSYIELATANTSLTDNANTNPRSLKFSELQYQSGVTRIEIYKIGLAEGEMDANGLPAWKIIEGTQPQLWNQIRLYGAGWSNQLNALGNRIFTSTSGDYILITGVMDAISLNVIVGSTSSNNIDVQLDGVDTGTNLSVRGSDSLQNYNIRLNQNMSDLSLKTTLGLHTYKIVNGASDANVNFNLYGFELISTTKQEQAGSAWVAGQNYTSFSQQTVVDPTLTGTKGAIAYRYIDPADCTRKWATREPASYTAKAVTTITIGSTTITLTTGNTADMVVDHIALIYDSTGKSELVRVLTVPNGTQFTCAATANAYSNATIELWGKSNTSVDHSNEVIIAERHFRMFGAGHSNDFQLIGSAGVTNRVFILDDNTTTFHTSSGGMGTNGINSAETWNLNSGSQEASYIFNGTGLDILICGTGSAVTNDYYVDGLLVKSLTLSDSSKKWYKIVSDLPNQTHIVRIVNSGANFGFGMQLFREYGLAKPTAIASLDENLIIAVKNMLPNYVFDYRATQYGFSKGVVAFAPNRGWFLTGSGWGLSVASQTPQFKYYPNTATNGDAAVMWFYGSGFEFLTQIASGHSTTVTLRVDGSILNSSFPGGFTAKQTSTYTNFNATTGNFSASNATTVPYKISITGLTEGWHSFQLTNGAAAQINIHGFGVIGGSWAMSQINGGLQQISTTRDGSCKDLRKFKADYLEDKKINFSTAYAITSDPSTSTSAYTPLIDMCCVLKTEGNPVEISFCAAVFCAAGGPSIYIKLYVDGVAMPAGFETRTTFSAGYNFPVSFSGVMNLPAGIHTFQLFWSASSSTISANSNIRLLTVKELKY